MNRIALLVLIPLLAVACKSSSKQVEAKPSKNKKQLPVTIHSKLKDDVLVAGFASNRSEDGRLRVQLVLENQESKTIPVSVSTTWFDDSGIVGESEGTPLVIPGGGSKVYEAGALDARADHFHVSILPMSQKRKK
jgi:uncharacterized protein YcfL